MATNLRKIKRRCSVSEFLIAINATAAAYVVGFFVLVGLTWAFDMSQYDLGFLVGVVMTATAIEVARNLNSKRSWF